MQGSLFLSGQRLSSGPTLCRTSCFHVQAPRVQARRAQPLVVENRVVIRFQRFGRKKRPFYRIVAIDSRSRRQGAPCEFLGWYNPLSKETNLNAPAIKKWLEVGATPSEAAARILKRAMVIEPDYDKAASA